MKNIMIAAGVALCLACSGNKKANKAALPSAQEDLSVADTFRVIDTDLVKAGVKYRSERSVDPANPPRILDYTGELETASFEGNKYFDTVSFVMLESPAVEGKPGFLTDCPIVIRYKGGMGSFEMNSNVWVGEDYIVAGDMLTGMYVYDKTGKMTDTLARCEFPFKYTSSPLEITYNADDRHGYEGGFTMNRNRCCYVVSDTGRHYKTVWYDLKLKRALQEQPWKKGKMGIQPIELDEKTYFVLYPTVMKENKIFLRVFGIRGDTLSEFTDYIRLTKKIRGNYTNPDSWFLYRLNGQQYIRQPYSDTVFRFAGANRLLPAYILNFGEKRTDITTGMLGDKSGKLIPSRWTDTKKMILFAYTENYDCRNNREKGQVKYFYSCFDKESGKLFRLPVENRYPDEFIVDLRMKNALPFTYEQLQAQDGKLIVTYTRDRLEKMGRTAAFKKLSPDLQAKLKEVMLQMNERQMYVMIVE